MKTPFSFRSISAYLYDGDGMFRYDRIKGKNKRRERKKQLRRFAKLEKLS
jgi:hypothetical protein